MTANDVLLAAGWSFVRGQLPDTPARVVELGCGSHGGFVPTLLDSGYDAVGVDPEAPDGPAYHQLEFEAYEPGHAVDAVIACTSLHHVCQLDEVLAKVDDALTPGGAFVVVEWDWQRFDDRTAQWCFGRLAPVPVESEPGWLHVHQAAWVASGLPWDDYLRGWATEHGLHTAAQMLPELDARFDRLAYAEGPYFFSELAAVTEADEQQAIDSKQISANGIRYAGRSRRDETGTPRARR